MIHFDCHAHVYEHIVAVPGARYIPKSPAPLARWTELLDQHALSGGVIVQVSFLGDDNSALCEALQQLGTERFAGVAVVPINVSGEEIQRLHSLGVRGFRWNLVQGGKVPELESPEVQDFLERMTRQGMHLEVHLESPLLAHLIGPLLERGVTLVVDHLGLPVSKTPKDDPWLQAIERLSDTNNLYVKLSAPYRTPFDTTAHVRALQSRLQPDRLIWGSDWPHTRHEHLTDFSQAAEYRDQLAIRSDTVAVRTLYGLAL